MGSDREIAAELLEDAVDRLGIETATIVLPRGYDDRVHIELSPHQAILVAQAIRNGS